MKYNITPQGLKHGYRSGLEECLALSLKEMGVNFKFESEQISYFKPVTNHKYTPDFVFKKKDGTKLYIETKGRFTVQDRKKHILIKQQHPELDIRFIFQYAKGKISKTSKTTYAMWADKNGFLWAQKTIPKEWLDECK